MVKFYLALQVPKEYRVYKVLLVLQVNRVYKVLLVPQVPRVYKVPQEQMGQMDPLVQRAQQVRKGHKVFKAQQVPQVVQEVVAQVYKLQVGMLYKHHRVIFKKD